MLILLDTIKHTFSRELTSHLAARLGEGESCISKALSGIVPLVLQAFASKAGAGDCQTLFHLSTEACDALHDQLGSVTGILGLMGRVQAHSGPRVQGAPLLLWLFGTNGTVISHPIGAFAGIKPISAISLLNIVAAMLPALLGQYVNRYQLRASSLSAGLLRLSARAGSVVPPALQQLAAMLELAPGPLPLATDSCRLQALFQRLKLAAGRLRAV